MTGKIVGVVNSEDPLVEIDINRDLEVLPGVEVHNTYFFGYFLAVDENALGDAGVLDSRFSNVDGLIREIIVHDARSDSEVFQLGLDNGFLEVTEKSEHLSVKLQPGRLNSRNVVVFSCLPWFLEAYRTFSPERLQ